MGLIGTTNSLLADALFCVTELKSVDSSWHTNE